MFENKLFFPVMKFFRDYTSLKPAKESISNEYSCLRIILYLYSNFVFLMHGIVHTLNCIEYCSDREIHEI